MVSHITSVTPTTFKGNDVVTVQGTGFDPSYSGLTCVLDGVTDPAFDGYGIGAEMHVTDATGTTAGATLVGYFSGTNVIPAGDYLLKITDGINGESDNSTPVTVTAASGTGGGTGGGGTTAPADSHNSLEYGYHNPGPGAVVAGSSAVGQTTEATHYDLNPAWRPSASAQGQPG